MATRKVKAGPKIVEIIEIERSRIQFHLIGVTPLIYNAMSFKTITQLLKPSGRKTKAEKQVTLKHEPYSEYVDSTYRRRAHETGGPTRLLMPSRSFKAAIADVAKRVPGAPATTEVKQLTYVEGTYVDLYGVPQIYLAPVRNSDMNRTPDIRTRALVEEWACTISVLYTKPLLTADTVTKLIISAGQINGVGDYRQQKGAGNFGQFRPVITAEDRQEFDRIMKQGGMKAQDDALVNPVAYDQETEEMLNWFDDQMSKRDDVSDDIEVGGEDEFESETDGLDVEVPDDAIVEAAAARGRKSVPRTRMVD